MIIRIISIIAITLDRIILTLNFQSCHAYIKGVFIFKNMLFI